MYSEEDQRSQNPFQLVEKRPDGITLFTIPFWWQGDIPSLLATLKKELPELPFIDMSPEIKPIPETLPQVNVRKSKSLFFFSHVVLIPLSKCKRNSPTSDKLFTKSH